MKRSTYCAGAAAMVASLSACAGAVDETDMAHESIDTTQQALSTNRHEDRERELVISCDQLASSLSFPDTTFTSSTAVMEGELVRPGQTIPAHCLLAGKMFERTSSVDGNDYAIGFEIRLPETWNRRFFYQANGGFDGSVLPAVGDTSGGGPLTSALAQGFAVISSDAGHDETQNPLFGIDPQARLDYGYQAVGKLTPMAKSVIRDAYGAGAAYAYIGGCSNGGRHAMVAASRYGDMYDGYLVGAPGFRLPDAAVASIYGAQQYAPLADPGAVIPGGPFAGLPDLSGAFTQEEQQLVVNQILESCDGLDGLEDGMVQDTARCQETFDLDSDVPTCAGARDGSCLSAAQKVAIGNIFSGAETSTGEPIYSSFPFDTGLTTGDVSFWEFISPLILDSGAVGFVFSAPPADPLTFIPPLFTLFGYVDQMAASTHATDATYTESAQSFMTPPDPEHIGSGRRGRVLVYHGVSDPIFSAEDTVRWYDSLRGRAKRHTRLYLVPGMPHCAGGPSTDQFDLLTPLVRWVERGRAPRDIVASARGPANPGGFNFELPPDWSPDRTRPLCPYPRVAVYKAGDVESADSFVCRNPRSRRH